MAIVQTVVLSVSHVLKHRASVYNSHLREPVTFTPVAECLAVEFPPPVLRLKPAANGIRTLKLPHARRTI